MPDQAYANPFMGDPSGGGLYGGVPGAGGDPGAYSSGLYGGIDPRAAGLLAAAQAFAQAGQASRVPQSGLGAFGAAAGSFGQGYGSAAQAQQRSAFQGAQMGMLGEQTQSVRLENAAKLLNMPLLELKSDIISGKRDPYTYALIGQQPAGGRAAPAPDQGAGASPASGGIPFGQGPVSSAVPDMAPPPGVGGPALGPVQAQGGQGAPGSLPLPQGWSPRNLMVNQALYGDAVKSYLDKYNERFGVVRPGSSYPDPTAPGGWSTAPTPSIEAERQKQAQEQFNRTGIPQQPAPGTAGARPETMNIGTPDTPMIVRSQNGVPLKDAKGNPISAEAAARQPVQAQPSAKPAADTVTTPKGTVVPSPTGRQVMGPGSDLIDKQNTESIATEKNWNLVRPTVETSRQRLLATSAALSELEGKGLNEGRADIANTLRGIPGLGWAANLVMSAKDTAAVKEIVWNSLQETLSGLKQVNQGGRVLNSEFNQFMEHGYSPDMPAATLQKAIAAQLGTSYQIHNMISDYNTVGRHMKPEGWLDANQFQSHYLDKNPLEGFVDYAKAEIGSFKGQAAQPSKPSAPPEQITVGRTITNHATGERQRWDGFGWRPLNAGQ